MYTRLIDESENKTCFSLGSGKIYEKYYIYIIFLCMAKLYDVVMIKLHIIIVHKPIFGCKKVKTSDNLFL